MRNTFTPLLSFLLFTSLLQSQSPAVAAIQKHQEGVNLGMSMAEMYDLKPELGQPDDMMEFRLESIETIHDNGLESVTYYFDAEGERPLYELIVEFASQEIREAAVFELFGDPDHPLLSGHYVLGGDEMPTVGWAFENKFVVAAEIPGTEWEGDEMFNFYFENEPNTDATPPSAWSEEDLKAVGEALRSQIESRDKHFEKIRGEALSEDPEEGFFNCQVVLPTAEEALLIRYDEFKWLINNTLYSNLTDESAKQFETELGAILPKLLGRKYQLQATEAQELFGSDMKAWQVQNSRGDSSGIMLGTSIYEWGESGRWNIALLVIEN